VSVFVDLVENLGKDLIKKAESSIPLNPTVWVSLFTDETGKIFSGKVVDHEKINTLINLYSVCFLGIKKGLDGYWEKSHTRSKAVDYLKNFTSTYSFFDLRLDVDLVLPADQINSAILDEYKSGLHFYPKLGNGATKSDIRSRGEAIRLKYIYPSKLLFNSSEQKISERDLLGYALDYDWFSRNRIKRGIIADSLFRLEASHPKLKQVGSKNGSQSYV
jgi:hypothetical protein